jgi:DNA polymerase III subunit epsilon
MLLILDTETTSLDPATGHLIEIAGALYSPDYGLVSVASTTVVPDKEYAPSVHGIDPRLAALGVPRSAVPEILRRWTRGHNVTHVAYNAAFDRQWLPPLGPWVCAMDDAEWPTRSTSRALTSVALGMGLGVSRAHRAVDDVLTLVSMLDRVAERDEGLGGWLALAREERVTVVGRQAFEENDIAKAHGFTWDGPTESWRRRVRVSQASAFVESLPFRAVTL